MSHSQKGFPHIFTLWNTDHSQVAYVSDWVICKNYHHIVSTNFLFGLIAQPLPTLINLRSPHGSSSCTCPWSREGSIFFTPPRKNFQSSRSQFVSCNCCSSQFLCLQASSRTKNWQRERETFQLRTTFDSARYILQQYLIRLIPLRIGWRVFFYPRNDCPFQSVLHK